MQEWIELYRDGKSLSFIAKKNNTTCFAVRFFLMKNGIRLESQRKFRKYFCNPLPFESIKTKEAAYWLGFLYADGCLTKEGSVNLLLHSKDVAHLEKFRCFLESNSAIHVRQEKIRKDGEVIRLQDTCKIRINNINLYFYLDRLGCTPKKTSTLTFPTKDQVPEIFLPDFIRGFFDGDGSVYYSNGGKRKYYKYAISFTSTEKFIKSLSMEIERLIGYKPCLSNHKSKGLATVA